MVVEHRVNVGIFTTHGVPGVDHCRESHSHIYDVTHQNGVPSFFPCIFVEQVLTFSSSASPR